MAPEPVSDMLKKWLGVSFVSIVLLTINRVSCRFTDKVGDPLVVTTSYGSVRGFYLNNTRAFYGIPYAMPPTGRLRWAKPSRPKPWSPEVLDATEPPKACLQKDVGGVIINC